MRAAPCVPCDSSLPVSVDFDQLKKNEVEYPVTAYFGPGHKPFCRFSGKFDRYSGDSYTERIVDVAGTSGPSEATLRYTAQHPQRNLVMPSQITLVPGADGESFALRVRQALRATGEPAFGDNLEFLHLVVNPQYRRGWEDGVQLLSRDMIRDLPIDSLKLGTTIQRDSEGAD